MVALLTLILHTFKYTNLKKKKEKKGGNQLPTEIFEANDTLARVSQS